MRGTSTSHVRVADPAVVYAVTPAGFGRVVDNLVANAVAAGAADVEVRIALDQQTPTATLVLTVRDDGPGVPESFLARAFDRFTRADEARRTTLGGSGLGLALCAAPPNVPEGPRRSRTGPTGRGGPPVHLPATLTGGSALLRSRTRTNDLARSGLLHGGGVDAGRHPITRWRGPRR